MLSDPLTLLVIAVAAIIGWRLWSVLGQRTGFEREWPRPLEGPSPKAIDMSPDREKTVPATSDWSKYGRGDASLAKALSDIAGRDRTFNPESFLAGASRAYEMINSAFAKGDKKALQPLLSREIMKEFSADIDRMQAAGERMSWQLVKVESTEMKNASLSGNLARIDVHFTSSVISSTVDKDGKIVEGHMTAIEHVEDVWTFERATNLSDPNWKLVATTPQ